MRPVSANKSDGIDEKVADFAYDVRLARRWKRRGIANQNFKLYSSSNRAPKKTIDIKNEVCKEEVVLNSCSNMVPNDGVMKEVEADADYERFLNGVRSYGDSEGDADADYRKFLNGIGIRSYGDGYGYGEDEGVVGCVDNNNNNDIGNENDDGDGNNNNNNNNNDIGNENDDADADADDDVDPQYLMFLGKLKADGTSYVLEVPLNDEMSVFVKYEKEDESCDGHKAEDLGATENCPRSATENCPKSENPKSQRILRSASKRMKTESLEILSDVIGKQKIERTSPMVEKKVGAADPVSTNERLIKRPRPENSHSAKHECNRNMKCDMVDESYQEFLSCLKNDGKSMVYMPQSGKQIIYDEDVESASDPEVIAMDDDPFSCENYTPFVAAKSYGSFKAEPGRSNQSQFREKLMDILKKPYDKKEHDDLWKEVSLRRPKERHRELRGRDRSCSLGFVGKSYLDYHKDLKAKIELAKREHEPCKILNFLRGFIYWLQNLTNEGAFQPWRDPLCLTVMPRTEVTISHNYKATKFSPKKNKATKSYRVQL